MGEDKELVYITDIYNHLPEEKLKVLAEKRCCFERQAWN